MQATPSIFTECRAQLGMWSDCISRSVWPCPGAEDVRAGRMPGRGAPWVTLDSLWGVLESYWEYLERTGGEGEKLRDNYQLSKHLKKIRQGWGGELNTESNMHGLVSV